MPLGGFLIIPFPKHRKIINQVSTIIISVLSLILYGNHVIRSQKNQSTRTFSSIFKPLIFNLKQVKPKIMAAPADGIQDPYLVTLDLSTYEHLKLYNKAILGIPESDSCDLTRCKWT